MARKNTKINQKTSGYDLDLWLKRRSLLFNLARLRAFRVKVCCFLEMVQKCRFAHINIYA